MFRFKQFTIQQDRTAMKVCTDACVLGAWADIANTPGQTETRLLDIGAGTGLLALMAAQRNPAAQIDAVELDEPAAGQAAENVAASPFAHQVRVWNTAIQTYLTPQPLYDHILTNPPFYTNSLRSPDKVVNRALHTDELSFTDLLVAVRRLLRPTGTWWVLLPPPESDRLTRLAAELPDTLQPVRQLQLRHHAQKPVFRYLTAFRFAKSSIDFIPERLAIYELDGRTYTADFRALLQPYYLIF